METREVPVSTLNEEEQKQIKRLNTMAPNGYNLTSGGERYKASEETKKRMSAAAKKVQADPARKAKMSAVQKKRWADPAVKAKMSAASKKMWEDPVLKARMSAAQKKHWEDPEYSARMSAAFSKKIVVTCIITQKATTYASIRQAVNETGFDHKTITNCCKALQIATGEYNIRYENESAELRAKHEDMLRVLTNTPCDVRTHNGRHLKSFSSAVEAVSWLRYEKKSKPNFWSAYKALTGKSKGYYGKKPSVVRIVRKGPSLDQLVTNAHI